MTRKPQDTDDGGNLFARWSRRKLAAKAEVPEEPAAAPGAAPVPDVPEADEDPVLKANREEAEAIDIDALTYESDFSPFLKSGVPGILRRRALRKLWTSHPVLANVDGLNDYDMDFNVTETAAFRSAWEVGKGYVGQLKDVLSTADERDGAAESAPEAGLTDTGDEPAPLDELTAKDEIAGEKMEQPEALPEPEPAVPRVPLRRRLMG